MRKIVKALVTNHAEDLQMAVSNLSTRLPESVAARLQDTTDAVLRRTCAWSTGHVLGGDWGYGGGQWADAWCGLCNERIEIPVSESPYANIVAKADVIGRPIGPDEMGVLFNQIAAKEQEDRHGI